MLGEGFNSGMIGGGLGFGSGSSINATFMILIVTVTHNPSCVLAAQTQNLSFLYFWSGLDVENRVSVLLRLQLSNSHLNNIAAPLFTTLTSTTTTAHHGRP